MDWQPIEAFTANAEIDWISDTGTTYYKPALVYGPTWKGVSISDDWPASGKGAWTGERRIDIAATHSSKGFWTISSDGPSDYDVHIQPTHWMPLPAPPLPSSSD